MSDDRDDASSRGEGGAARGGTGNAKSRVHLTTVHTYYCEGRANYRVLFGAPLRIDTLEAAQGVTRCMYSFEAGARFGLDLWRSNAYGTIEWRCFVCEADSPRAWTEAVPIVAPGVRVLLSTKGAAQSRLFLAWLADLESGGLDPLQCPAETFEAAHFRLQGSRADRTPPRRLSNLL